MSATRESPPAGTDAPTGRAEPAPVPQCFPSFTLALAVFGAGMAAAFYQSLLEQNLNVYRAKFSIWVSLALTGPALCALALGPRSPAAWRFWRWFWTFGFLAYAAHFYYSLRAFHYSLPDVYARQGASVATANLVVSCWWAVDVLLAWILREPRGSWGRAMAVERHLAALATLGAFFVASVLFKQGFVRYLGLAVTVLVAGCLIIRILDGLATTAPRGGAEKKGPWTSLR